MPLASKCVELAEAKCEICHLMPQYASKLSKRYVPAVFDAAKKAAKHCDPLLDSVIGGAMNRIYFCGESAFSAVTMMQERVREAIVESGDVGPQSSIGSGERKKWEPSGPIVATYAWDFPLTQKQKMERQFLAVSVGQAKVLQYLENNKRREAEKCSTVEVQTVRVTSRAQHEKFGSPSSTGATCPSRRNFRRQPQAKKI
eukprot:GEMP01038105.1.p1 GENE.GEMP01038105.1~~GEMP01038105.1.p1  ORF type:complete len:200 (+),score=49.43 GEMP01038105.1:333-932(+)